MAYIGKSPVIGNFVKLDAITAVNGQAAYTMQNGGSNFTDYESVNQFLVSLNGTIQAPTDSFTVSGSTLTFASNLSTGDVIDFIMVFGNSLSAGTPTDATVSTAKIVDSAVTTAKINANAVTSAKLNNDIISGATELATTPADTDEFLVSDAGTIKRVDYSHIKGGGITMVDNWRLTTSFSTGDVNPLSSNLERNDTASPSFGYYGSQMSVSSGIWTFPSTGIYRVDAVAQFSLPSGNQYNGVEIHGTANNSSYITLAVNYNHIVNVTNPTYSQTVCNCMLDITDTANQKIKFRIINANSATTVLGDSTYDITYFRFTRLGDT
ncbi:hypothetical protein HTVC035P_gp41 [Pelagibacter phage HTVC035P]|nr:hypothetical protein HTVC035P_gp41 [Pelagibacter phage HTVC035P]